jgi:16S rRNA U516 pseudouridylate synthase RsuA-like enzyme
MQERLSKIMAQRGLCSRREADRYIERGLVIVDGVRITELGTKILPPASLEEVRGTSRGIFSRERSQKTQRVAAASLPMI